MNDMNENKEGQLEETEALTDLTVEKEEQVKGGQGCVKKLASVWGGSGSDSIVGHTTISNPNFSTRN